MVAPNDYGKQDNKYRNILEMLKNVDQIHVWKISSQD